MPKQATFLRDAIIDLATQYHDGYAPVSVRKVARLFGITYSTLSKRLSGGESLISRWPTVLKLLVE
jgi:hypothetical protein